MVTFEIGIPEVLGIIAGATAAYFALKARIKKFRILVDVVDDALVDDKVSEAEFAAIWQAVKGLLAK